MLQFDEATTRLLDDAYQGTDVVRRRMASLRALQPAPGDQIADIGCGPGLMMLELSRAVGANGMVFGIDPSPDMCAASRQRCAGRENISVIEGTADELPFKPDSLDKAVSVQVFEYIEDIPAALAEIRRVLRPGGLLVIGNTHWDSFIWHSDDPARMRRMMDAWERHMVHRNAPAILPPMLREAGYGAVSTTHVPFTDTIFRYDGLARMMRHLMAAYAKQNGLVEPAEADAWAAEQDELASSGRFFHHITHFVTLATRL